MDQPQSRTVSPAGFIKIPADITREALDELLKNNRRARGFTVSLTSSIVLGGTERTTVDIRRPKAKDVELAEARTKGDERQALALLAHLCGMAPEEFSELDLSDIELLGECSAALSSNREARSAR